MSSGAGAAPLHLAAAARAADDETMAVEIAAAPPAGSSPAGAMPEAAAPVAASVPRRLRILLVDDDEVDRKIVQRSLRRPLLEVEVDEVVDVAGAVAALTAGGYDCAILDYRLPDGDAFDVLAHHTEGGPATTPIIVLTGLENEDLGVRLLASGAQDYLVKSDVSGDALRRAIRYAIERHRIQRQLDAANARLEELSLRDPLTGLLNRRGLERVLETELARVQRSAEPLIAVLVDCDDFKSVNEAFGLTVGDQVLQRVADCLRRAARATDHVARLGGDEFLVLLPETRSADAIAVGERICAEVRDDPVALSSGTVPLSVSVGAAAVPFGETAIRDAVAATHMALRRVKTHGKDQVVWSDSAHVFGRPVDMTALETRLRRGEGLHVVAQQLVAIELGRPVGYELLIRGPAGFERPDELFAAAREFDVLTEVDLRCLDTCLGVAETLSPGLRVQLNVFPSTLLATPVEQLLELFGDLWRDRSLYIEISDRWILGDPAQLRGSLEFLAAAGVGIALDHVGFGRSSLEALLLLGPQVIKTDARLVRGIGGDPARRRSLRRLLAIADSVGSELIALGVESADDLDALRDMGVRFAQGDGLGTPGPLPAAARA